VSVRDREAPGFKSRAPDQFRVQIADLGGLSLVAGTQPDHNFPGKQCNRDCVVVSVLSRSELGRQQSVAATMLQASGRTVPR